MTVYHKPSAATRLFNSVWGRIAGAGLSPRTMVTLEVRGRRTGQPRRVPVNWIDYEGSRYLVSPRGETDWVRNVRAAAGEAVILHGKRTPVRLEEVPPEDRAPIIKKYLARNAVSTRAHFGVDPKADISEFERIAAAHPVFRIVET